MFNSKILYVILGFVLSLAVLTASLVFGAEVLPGSEDDPLVSKSYVDELIEDLRKAFGLEIDELRESLGEPGEGGQEQPVQSPSASSFMVVEVPGGTSVIGFEGTEIIVRSGYAFAIDNGEDGVSDLTAGVDLKGGDPAPKNHLLLVPRSDGRGISCQGLCYVMIKGEYSFE